MHAIATLSLFLVPNLNTSSFKANSGKVLCLLSGFRKFTQKIPTNLDEYIFYPERGVDEKAFIN